MKPFVRSFFYADSAKRPAAPRVSRLIVRIVLFLLFVTLPGTVRSGTYTNLAGHVISGTITASTNHVVYLRTDAGETKRLPLSVFPESEQRRINLALPEPVPPPQIVKLIESYNTALRRNSLLLELGRLTEDEYAVRRQALYSFSTNRLYSFTTNGAIHKMEADYWLGRFSDR